MSNKNLGKSSSAKNGNHVTVVANQGNSKLSIKVRGTVYGKKNN